MRPQQLFLQAFGPYANKELIDFTKLGNRNMFVISGKTGSGKTTIFDGISFAIYGKASGDDRNGQDLRSHFADPDIATEVSLKFQLRDKTYYIWRSPMQEKMKKSGDGSTVVGAKAELYEVTNDGKELLAANVREVDEKIKQIIGLDATQFKQILMIPQGDFKKLLVSESKEKEVILQKLFHTQIYKRIEEKLKEDATFVKKQEEQLKVEIQALIADIEWHKDRVEEEYSEMNPESVVQLLLEDVEKGQVEFQALQQDVKQKEIQEKKIQNELFQGKEIVAKFDERNKLQVAKGKLEAEQAVISACKLELQAAEKASQLEKQEQSYLRIGNRMAETKTKVDQLKQQSLSIESNIRLYKQDYENEAAKTEEREAAATKVIGLQELKNDVLTFASFQHEVRQYEKHWKESQAKRLSLESQAEKNEEKISNVEQTILQSQKATIQYSETHREKEKNEELLQIVKESIVLTAEIKQMEATYNKIQKDLVNSDQELQQEKTKLNHIEKILLESHASLLATELREGEPCAVCGSTVHPNPAFHNDSASSQLDFEQQKEKVALLDDRKYKIQREMDRIQVQLEHSRKHIEKQLAILDGKIAEFQLEKIDQVLEKLAEKGKQLAVELTNLSKQKALLPQLEEQVLELKKQQNLLLQSAIGEKEKEDAAKEKFIQFETKLLELKDRLPEHLRTVEGFEKALQEAILKRTNLQQALEKKQVALQNALQEETKVKSAIETYESNLNSLQVELDEERELFKKEMEKQGFENYQTYKSSKKNEQEIHHLHDRIERYEKELQRVLLLLTNLENILEGKEVPDIVEMERKVSALSEEINQVRAKLTELQVHIQHNEKIVEKMGLCLVKQKEVQLKYQTIGHLYEMAKGQNPFRITFERFVLASFLDDILLEANERLKKMTSGRYQLLRKIDPTRRNIQSGLELSVFDQYTGMERHVKTLSGGESFKASLSLALGLAAVVQQNAGGISLETMFIDEGFGTLDPESLDQAIEALLDIQSSGRLVGIISHVPELKERIDARLEVIGRQDGSTTQFVLS